MRNAIQPRTILYIEDDPASLALVERALRFAGYRVLVADRGLVGIDIARREVPDLILTDINLPDLSGREITTTLRSDKRFKDTPIVALTAQDINEQREMTIAAGITGYLTKPVDIEKLEKQVAYYLEGGHDPIDVQALPAAQARYIQEVVGRLESRIRELERVNQSLRQLDQMKDMFIQLTAHELRTPLTLVYGYSRLLEDNPFIRQAMNDDASAQMLVEGMNDSISRMQKLINEIVTMSRIMTNQIELVIVPLQPLHILQRAIQSFQPALEERKITINYHAQGFPPQMRADADLLMIAFSNLISNAIKYTPDNGNITVSAGYDSDTFRMTIRDSGIGIDRNDLANIFERFHTTGALDLHSTSKTAFRGGGIGLGLAITRGIIEAHEGTIRIDSTGRDIDQLPGTEVIIQLPLFATERIT